MSPETNKNVYVRILLFPTSGKLHTTLGLLCLHLATRGIVNRSISGFALCRSVSIVFRKGKDNRIGIPIQMFFLLFFQLLVLAFISFLYIISVLFQVDSTLSNEQFTHRFYSRTCMSSRFKKDNNSLLTTPGLYISTILKLGWKLAK